MNHTLKKFFEQYSKLNGWSVTNNIAGARLSVPCVVLDNKTYSVLVTADGNKMALTFGRWDGEVPNDLDALYIQNLFMPGREVQRIDTQSDNHHVAHMVCYEW